MEPMEESGGDGGGQQQQEPEPTSGISESPRSTGSGGSSSGSSGGGGGGGRNDDDDNLSGFRVDWQELPDSPGLTWEAFPDAPYTVYDPQYHPGRLLWDRATTGVTRRRHRPAPPYAVGFTPKDIQRLRFVTQPIVPGQTGSRTRPLTFSAGPVSSDPGPNTIWHDGCVNAACWSSDGRRLLTGSDDRLVKVWEARDKGWESLFAVQTGHQNNVFQVSLRPGAPNMLFTCAADGCIRSFDLSAPLESPPPPTVRSMGPVTITSNVLDPVQVNARVVGSHRSIVHGFKFWEGGHQGGAEASTLFAALDEGVVVRYDLRAPPRQGEAVIDRRRGGRGVSGAIKAVAIPDPNNFARGVSPWMICVGGLGAGLDVYDIRRLPSATTAAYTDATAPAPLRRFCPRGLPADARAMQRAAQEGDGTESVEEVSVSGLAFSRRRAELLVSYQGDQIYGFRLDSETGEEEKEEAEGAAAPALEREAWSVGGHLNSQTFLKTVAYFGPNEEYVTSGCDTGHTWVWDRRTGALAAFVATDTSIANGVVPHPWAPMLACYGIDHEVKVLEAGGRFFSCFRKPEHLPEDYIADDARGTETDLQRGRPEWTRHPIRQRRTLVNYMEHHLMPKVFPGGHRGRRGARPRFVRDAWRWRSHVARVRKGLAAEVRLAAGRPGLEDVGMDARTRRLLLMLPDYPSDLQDWLGRPRRLAGVFIQAEEGEGESGDQEGGEEAAPAPRTKAAQMAAAYKRWDMLGNALVCIKDRGNAFFKAKRYDRAEECYDKVAAFIPHVKAWLAVPDKEVEVEAKRLKQQQQQGAGATQEQEQEQGEQQGDEAGCGGGGGGDSGQLSEAEAKAICINRGLRLRELGQVTLLNMAACALATGRPEEALSQLDMILGHYDPDNAKALYRKGAALMALNRSEEAVEVLAKAAKIAPEDQLVKRKLAEARHVWQAEKKRQARAYSAFFSSGGGGGGGEE